MKIVRMRRVLATLASSGVLLIMVILWPRSRDKSPPTPLTDNVFVFGIFSDLQFSSLAENGTDLESGRTRYYRDSLVKLRRAVDDWRRSRVRLILNLGDILDASSTRLGRRREDLAAVEREFGRLLLPTGGGIRSELGGGSHGTEVLHLIGNHDLYNADLGEWQRILLESMTMSVPGPDFRRSFSPTPGVRFLVLHSYALSVLGGDGMMGGLDGRELLNARNPNYNKNLVKNLEGVERRWTAYNGGLGDEQLEWLQARLTAASAAGEKVLLFSHIPLHPQSSKYFAWDYDKALDCLAKFPDTVVAAIAGHDHAGGFHRDKERGLSFLTLRSMVEEMPGTEAHYTAVLHPGKLVVTRGKDRMIEIIWSTGG